ncbi:MAG: DNA sulfur modification protein DndE [Motiliproteus sp.]
MLPNRMNLTKLTEDRLKRLKQNTGITPNVSSRIAFFRSLEKGFNYRENGLKLDGTLNLDKFTWLGDTSAYVELLLKQKYPELDDKQLVKAWAAHVDDGIASIRNLRSLGEFAAAL